MDPLFANPGHWDSNATPDDPNDDFWVEGDYHLKSQAGRRDPNSQSWVQDNLTSPCIDTGDPNSPIGHEPYPNGGIINMGAYGGTAEASMSPSGLHANYGGGTGEPNDPYLIYTAEQMYAIGTNPDDWNKHFKLMAHIDLSAYTGTDFNIIGYWVDWSSPDNKPFAGVFDGNGYTISNFTCTSKEADRIGLFEYVDGENTQVKDLGLIDPNIDARIDVGSLVGWLYKGSITNCYVEGGSIMGNDRVGGLVGHNLGTITNCYANTNVTGGDYIGGLVGYNDIYSRISGCYSTGRISGREYVGGLVGNNRGAITNCYAIGSVSGSKIVDGLAGGNGWPALPTSRPYPPGDIINCYSTGSVSGNYKLGGLVGKQGYGSVTATFWDIQTSNQTTSEGGIGKTTAEMQTASTFLDAGWDFVDETANGTEDIWWILEGQDYPQLLEDTY